MIRRFTPEDGDAVNAVARAAFAQYEGAYADWPTFIDGIGRMADLAAPPTRADVLVAYDPDGPAGQTGRIAGAIAHIGPGLPRSAYFPGDWSVIRMLVVDPACRGRGHGARLVAGCLRLAQESDAPVVGLHTTPLMASALRMYEAIGFVRDRELDPIRGVPYGRYVLPAQEIPRALAVLDAR